MRNGDRTKPSNVVFRDSTYETHRILETIDGLSCGGGVDRDSNPHFEGGPGRPDGHGLQESYLRVLRRVGGSPTRKRFQYQNERNDRLPTRLDKAKIRRAALPPLVPYRDCGGVCNRGPRSSAARASSIEGEAGCSRARGAGNAARLAGDGRAEAAALRCLFF